MFLQNIKKAGVFFIFVLCVMFLTACDAAFTAQKNIKSSDALTCREAVDKILLESDEDGIQKMKDIVVSGEANTQAVVDRLLTIESDKSLSEKFYGRAHFLLLDIYYGEMGDTALRIFENDPRSIVMLDSIFEEFYLNKDYNIRQLANITTPAVISKLLDYYMAPNQDAVVSSSIAEILKQSKLNDTFLSYWPAYYETNGLDGINAGVNALGSAFLNVPLNEYENILSNLYMVSGLDCNAMINNILIEDDWDAADIRSLDSNKVVILEIQDEIETGTPAQFSWSPYSFILVPKEKCLSAEDLYNAGTVICIHRTVQFSGTYTPMGIDPSMVQGGGMQVYSQSVIITKADRVNKDITMVQVLDGMMPGDEISVQTYGNTFMANPPTEEDIIRVLRQILQN